MVSLHLLCMHKYKDNEIIIWALNPLWSDKPDVWVPSKRKYKLSDKPKDANLMKPFVFTLFPDVHEVRITATDHPFDFLSFLRLLQSVDVPESLQWITIEAGYPSWIEKAFNKVKDKYTAANIEYAVDRYTLSLKL